MSTVARRYLAGHTLLIDFVVEEAADLELSSEALGQALRVQAALIDGLLVAVGKEHTRETEATPGDVERRRLALVRRLLAGERADVAALGYPFETAHLGLIAAGSGAEAAVSALAVATGRPLLSVRPEPSIVWAWLGGQLSLDPSATRGLAVASCPAGSALALGEPADGPEGWRLSHRQAAAALLVARRGREPVVRYAEVALLATALGDELLIASLRRSYLEPLERGKGDGRTTRETLRAYFAADRNVSSAAALLHASRNTVSARLRAVEAILDRPLSSCASELELALELDDLSLV